MNNLQGSGIQNTENKSLIRMLKFFKMHTVSLKFKWEGGKGRKHCSGSSKVKKITVRQTMRSNERFVNLITSNMPMVVIKPAF